MTPNVYPHAGTAVVKYYDHNTFVGERTQYCAGYEGVSAHWPHTAYFCPLCGEIWGREVYEYQFQYTPLPPTSWVVEIRRCAEHGDGQFLAGKDSILFSCSPNLLRREYLVLSKTKGLPAQATVQRFLPPQEYQSKRLVSARARFQTTA